MKGSKKFNVEVQDIINSINKYGKDNILTMDKTVFRDNQANKNLKQGKSSKQAYDCTWIPFKLKLENGDEINLKNLKFTKVLTSSAAKLPHSTNEDSIKNMVISFKNVSEEEILAAGDYAPKKMDDQFKQKAEDERALTRAKEYVANTRRFFEALEAIDLSYKKLTEELKKSDDLEFTLNKDSNSVKSVKETFKSAKLSKAQLELEKNKLVNVYSIVQTSYENPETKEEVEFENPLVRIKLMVSKDGQVGTDLWDSEKRMPTFTPNVYNARKLDKNGNPVLAKVKVNGKLTLLTVNTVGSFITYRSLVSGIIDFSEIVVSKFGISLSNKFKVLYVKRHKGSMSEPAFSPSDFKEMRGSDNESDDDVVINNDNPVDLSDLEDKDNSEPEIPKVTSKSKTSKVAKSAKPTTKPAKPTKPVKGVIKEPEINDDEKDNEEIEGIEVLASSGDEASVISSED